MQTTHESAAAPALSSGSGLNLYLLGCALVAALGGLLFGFDTAVISGTTDALRANFAAHDNLLGFTVASALIGTILGSIGAGRPADAFGRRGALAILGVLYFVSAARLRAGLGLVVVPGLPFPGRPGRGRGVGGLADVHRRDFAGPLSRPAGGDHAVQRRARHPAGLPLELRRSAACTWARTSGAGCSA